MYMLQQYDKAKQKLLERRALEERRIKLAIEAGLDPEELLAREKEQARLRKEAGEKDSTAPAPAEKAPAAKPSASKKATSNRIEFEDEEEDEDDLF